MRKKNQRRQTARLGFCDIAYWRQFMLVAEAFKWKVRLPDLRFRAKFRRVVGTEGIHIQDFVRPRQGRQEFAQGGLLVAADDINCDRRRP